MKKLKLFALALMLALVAAIPAMADQVDVYQNNQLVKSVVFKIGVPEYVVNGQTPGVKMDVAPFIQNDRTFVPVRFLGNALGVTDDNINWNNDVQRVFIAFQNKISLVMQIGVKEIQVNATSKPIDVAPILRSDRTFLPARYVAEGLGYQVGWDEATQTVVCWPAGQPKPDVTAAVDYLTGQQPVTPPVQPPVTGNTVNGYTIPANTDLNVSTTGYKNSGSIVFNIQLKKGNLQQQYADAQSILSQTVDPATVDAAMSYAKQGETKDGLLPIKTFNSSNRMAVRVGVGGGYTVEIQVWPTN